MRKCDLWQRRGELLLEQKQLVASQRQMMEEDAGKSLLISLYTLMRKDLA